MSDNDSEAMALLSIAYGFLQDRLAAGDRDTRNQLLRLLEVEDRKAVRLTLDGQKVKVGSVTHAKGSRSARITDEEALIAWAMVHQPDAVEEATVTRLAPWFTAQLLLLAKEHGVVTTPDGEPMPGVTVKEGDSKIVVNRDKSEEAQAALIGELFANNGLGMRRVLALEPAEDES
jgi:hypothetical protein